MRVAIAGTRSFGVAVLDAALKDGHDVACIFAPVDDKLHDYAVWNKRIPANITVTPEVLAHNDVDVLIGAHSHSYVGRKSRAATRLGAFGYHPSLLPVHRGKDAVRWTVRDRDRIAGGTTYWFNDTVDGGPIAAQDWCHVRPEWKASDLWAEALFPMGVQLIRDTLDNLGQGVIVAIPQDESLATVEPSFDAPRLFRPELPAIGSGPEGFRTVGSRQDTFFRARGVQSDS